MYKLLGSIKNSWSLICERLYQYALLIRLNRPIGVFLLLWPTLWGLWIAAEGFPNINVFIVFVLGVFIMRSAGCALNDIADKRFDTFVIRTRTRPLAAGKITSIEALIVAISLIFIALLLVLTMNELTIQLSLFAVILAGVYPFMKRYTYLPQFFLGLTFGWSIPMAFAAQTNTVPKIAWLLLVTNILWSVVYDTIYAMIDREEDLKIGVKSTAILFDDADRVIIAIIQALVLLALIAVGRQLKLDYNYFISLIVAACFFFYQLRLIWNREPQQCMRAFINNNWVGLTIFIGIFLSYF
ncbi:MAG: 4-hydroxybenzoate octaprenyltransferase [Legionellales bacterium]|nr:4-hydroxybenzoate octaprenyltransferase [Legionellales bacterium]